MSGHALPCNASVQAASAGTRRAAAKRGMVSNWLHVAARLFRVIEERRILGTLDDRMLADIGINQLEAQREAGRLPWDMERRS